MNTPTYTSNAGRGDALAPNPGATTWRRVSWGAIIAGVIVAMVLQLVLSLLGAGIGLSTIDPLRASSPDPATFGLAAGAWWVLSSALSLFCGGWVAAHLAGAPDKTDASLHGLLTWGLATIITVYLVASVVGSAVGGAGKLMGTAATAGAAASAGPAGDAARRQLPNDVSLDSLKNQAQQRLAQAANPGAPATDPAAPLTEEQKAQAEAKARQVADQAAKRSSQAALAALLALVIGAIAATFGGSLAGRRYWVVSR